MEPQYRWSRNTDNVHLLVSDRDDSKVCHWHRVRFEVQRKLQDRVNSLKHDAIQPEPIRRPNGYQVSRSRRQ
jgi:hypothetical protein